MIQKNFDDKQQNTPINVAKSDVFQRRGIRSWELSVSLLYDRHLGCAVEAAFKGLTSFALRMNEQNWIVLSKKDLWWRQ